MARRVLRETREILENAALYGGVLGIKLSVHALVDDVLFVGSEQDSVLAAAASHDSDAPMPEISKKLDAVYRGQVFCEYEAGYVPLHPRYTGLYGELPRCISGHFVSRMYARNPVDNRLVNSIPMEVDTGAVVAADTSSDSESDYRAEVALFARSRVLLDALGFDNDFVDRIVPDAPNDDHRRSAVECVRDLVDVRAAGLAGATAAAEVAMASATAAPDAAKDTFVLELCRLGLCAWAATLLVDLVGIDEMDHREPSYWVSTRFESAYHAIVDPPTAGVLMPMDASFRRIEAMPYAVMFRSDQPMALKHMARTVDVVIGAATERSRIVRGLNDPDMLMLFHGTTFDKANTICTAGIWHALSSAQEFGDGNSFYLSTRYELAIKWALRRCNKQPNMTVLCFEVPSIFFDEREDGVLFREHAAFRMRERRGRAEGHNYAFHDFGMRMPPSDEWRDLIVASREPRDHHIATENCVIHGPMRARGGHRAGAPPVPHRPPREQYAIRCQLSAVELLRHLSFVNNFSFVVIRERGRITFADGGSSDDDEDGSSSSSSSDDADDDYINADAEDEEEDEEVVDEDEEDEEYGGDDDDEEEERALAKSKRVKK